MKVRKVDVKSSHGQIILSDIMLAEGFFTRAKGLMGYRSLKPDEGMFFPRCQSIHMWFMRATLDVVFLKQIHSQEYQVTSVYTQVTPWKFLPLSDWKASETLELGEGSIERNGFKVGDLLCIG